MQNFIFQIKLNNILLVVKKNLSFDQNLLGDFELKKNLLKKMIIKILFILDVKF